MEPNLLTRNAPIVLALMLASTPGFPKTAANDLRATVLLYDYVNLPADARAEAKQNASRILGQAGLAVEFIECSIGGAETGHPDCTGLLAPAVFNLRIFPPRRAEYGKQLGYAVMAPEGGAYITMFINPAERKARVASLSEGALLGHVIAHEIGHLLLGPNGHSTSGIMRPTWRPLDEEWMAKGALQFDSGQARKMQSALLARMQRR
jgi:hypothetical protein